MLLSCYVSDMSTVDVHQPEELMAGAELEGAAASLDTSLCQLVVAPTLRFLLAARLCRDELLEN